MARTSSSSGPSAVALRGAAALACLAAASAGRPAPHPAAAGLLGAAAAVEGAAGPEAAGWAAGRHQPCKRGPTTFPAGERVLTARAHETLDVTALPESWFWGDVDGVNYLTESRNQHIVSAFAGGRAAGLRAEGGRLHYTTRLCSTPDRRET